jgi:hypothetical protein
MTYAEHIPSQDPLTPQDEQERQAGIAFARMSRGRTADEVAEELGISRRMVYYRLKMISAQMPDKEAARAILFGRNEHWINQLAKRLEVLTDRDQVNMADYVRSIAELRQLGQRQAALLRVEVSDPEPPESPTDAPDPWVDGARADAEAELAEVDEQRNGRAP